MENARTVTPDPDHADGTPQEPSARELVGRHTLAPPPPDESMAK